MQTFNFWILYIAIIWFNWLGTYQVKEEVREQTRIIQQSCNPLNPAG